MAGEKKAFATGVKLTRTDREALEALAFSDDRAVAYVTRRAVQEGIKVLQAHGVAPKRPASSPAAPAKRPGVK